MSTMDAAYNLPQAGALPAHALVRDTLTAPGPWGFWGSLGWCLFAGAAGVVAVFLYTISWMITHGLRTANPQDMAYAEAIGMLMLSAPIAVLVMAAKIRKISLRSYFALEAFSRRNLALGLIGVIALIVVFDIIERLMESTVGPNTSKRPIARPRPPACCRCCGSAWSLLRR